MAAEIPKQQKIILAVLAAAGLFMFYSKVYSPIGDKIKESEEALKKKKSELVEMQKQSREMKKLEEEMVLLEQQLLIIEGILPKDAELPTLIRTITDTVRKFDMEVEVLRPGGLRTLNYYSILPFGMTLENDYHTFGAFFTEIAKLKRVFSVSNVKFSSQGEDKLTASFELLAFAAKK